MAAAPVAPPPLNLRSTSQILHQSLSNFLSSLLPLLLASLILFSFRSSLFFTTLHLTTSINSDPSIRSLLSRLSSPSHSPLPPPPPLRRRRPPFLHLSRVGTLDDDEFFSDSELSTKTSISSSLPLNSTFFNPIPLFLGLRQSAKNYKFRVSVTPKSPIHFFFPGENEEEDERDRAVELRIFGRGLDLTRQDAVIILYLLSLLSSTHAFAILGFILSYTFVLGTVFFVVASSYLRKPISVIGAARSGARLGIRRLTGFVFLWWAARDAVIQFLCIWFFAEIRDQNKLFNLFIKVKLLPFSFTAPLLLTEDDDLSGIRLTWAVLDSALSFIFIVVPWVLIMDSNNLRRRGPDVVKEGCNLVSLMTFQAVWIKIFEMTVCGALGRNVLFLIGGRVFAGVFQSVAEVYFMVVWLIFYFAARCKDGELEGRRFGQRDLEDCIDGLR